jgi:hypothetical protein
MRAYFKAEGHKKDEIAARQRSALSEFQGPRDKKLRVTDVIKMFNEMKDGAAYPTRYATRRFYEGLP